MQITIYDAVVKTYQQLLPVVENYLAKGRSHYESIGSDPNVAVDLKLTDDMLPLHFQVVSVVHHSANALKSLETGKAGPPNFSLAFDLAGLQTHVQEATEAVNAIDADAFNARADDPVVFELGEMKIPFKSSDFLLSFSLPNFYFHATTGYDLLRMDGVDLGKMDFLGAMRVNA